MIEIKAGYLLEMNPNLYGCGNLPSYFIVIPLQNGLNLFGIEQYYDENLSDKMCFKIDKWQCNIKELKEIDVLKIYGLCNCGRLTDIKNRELLWENEEVFA